MSDLFSGKLGQLLKIARAQNKRAFVDPAMAGGGGGAPPMDPAMGGAPPMDPMMGGGGGAPPMDPAMMGMDPAMMGMDPAMMGMDPAMMGGAPPAPEGGGGGGDDIRAIIKEELAASGLTGASSATEDDLTEMASAGAGVDPAMAAGAIPPIGPIGGASPEPKAAGHLGNSLDTLSDRASAMAHVMSRQRA